MQDILFWLKNNYKDLLIGILLLIIIGLLLYDIFTKEKEESKPVDIIANNDITEIPQEEDNLEKEKLKFNVDIKGAVKKPGVYSLDEGSIINDVVTLAGGFNSNAYKSGINLSKKISDEMVVYVYTKSEISSAKKEETSKDNLPVCEVPSYNICECVDNKDSVIVTNPNASSGSNSSTPDANTEPESTLVNINTADVKALTSITGIGESKAQAIIKYREENGNFKTIEDILNVSGIGDSLFAKIKDYITV